jgi:hypothetical protein
LSAERERLQSERDRLEEERDRLAEEQKRAEAAEAIREDLRERLAGLEARYQGQRQSSSLSSLTDPQTLATLLEAKLLTWQIIGSDPVASQYPELYDTMDQYLDSFGEQRLFEGRYGAVEDMITVINAVLSAKEQEPATELWKRYGYTDREDLLLRLIDKLELLLE